MVIYFVFRLFSTTFAADMETIKCIRLCDLGIGYRVKGSEKLIAGGINAEIHDGELTCLLGRNGIGKSTLLRTLCGFQPPLYGRVEFIPLLTSSKRGRDEGAEWSKMISVVLTEKPDVRGMTVRELVELGRSPHTGFWGILTDDDRVAVSEALDLVGITSLAKRRVHTLSDGERQKVMIAKALAQQTPVILLDEPTDFLDFPGKIDVMQLLLRLAHEQHKIILLSTHDIELALQMSDCIWLMDNGPLDLPLATEGMQERTTDNGEPPHSSPSRGGGRTAGIHIGTPRGLAENGTLDCLIAHKGVVFDAERLTIIATGKMKN